MKRTRFTEVIKTKHNGRHLAKKADEKIKHCRNCNCCWETDYQAIRNYSPSEKVWRRREAYIYYDDFVTYGKVKETCPKCLATPS